MGTSKGWKKVRAGDVTLEQLATYFQVSNRAEGKSPATIRWYDQNIALFIRFLGERGYSTAVRDVGLPEAREFIISLQSQSTIFATNPWTPTRERNLSSHSINTAARAIRSFFHWLKREGYTDTHKLQEMKIPRVQKKMVDILSKEEIARLLGALNPRTATGSRDHAIVMVLLDCGLRASELLTLKDRNVNLEEGSLRVVGKGNKERIVPIGNRVTKALVQYRNIFRPEPSSPARRTIAVGLLIEIPDN